MPLPQIDATLARFGTAIDVMTSNLLDLDANPTSHLLEAATLTGMTATRIATARQTLGRLWEQFGQFKDLVDRARTLRGNGNHITGARIDELDRLLHGPSVTRPPIEIPLAERGLLTPAETPVSTTPDQLVADMVAAFDNAKREILAVDRAWNVLVPRLEAARADLTRLSAMAAGLGLDAGPALSRCQSTVSSMADAVASDPLAVDPAGVDQLGADLSALQTEVVAATARRDGLSKDLALAHTDLKALTKTIEDGGLALVEARAKVIDPAGLLEPVGRDCLDSPAHGLVAWLARLDGLAAAGDWKLARSGLDRWRAMADATRATANKVAAANTAPLRQRDELRGRLDAFRAKAIRVGRAEDAELAALADRARLLLFTAPADLDAAAALVAQYGAALSYGVDAQ